MLGFVDSVCGLSQMGVEAYFGLVGSRISDWPDYGSNSSQAQEPRAPRMPFVSVPLN